MLSVRGVGKIESGRIGAPRPRTVRLLADAFGLTGAERDEFLRAAVNDEPDSRSDPAEALPSGTPRIVPAQLPGDVRGFTGRGETISRLDELLTDHVGTIAVVSGTAGIGKTTLAVHWAHRVVAAFPHGQLYVNLRGYDPTGEPMSPAEAVRGFLDALDVPPDRIPPSLDAQAALYRSLLAGRRVLVILDNARDTDQVWTLLPGTPSAFTVVTSRNQLTGLVAAGGAQSMILDLLDAARSRDLLAGRLGPARVADEPLAVDEIIARCAGLPLALTITAASAVQSGFPLDTIAADLHAAEGRLDALDTGDATGQVRAVFSWSYGALTTPAARLFRLLGLPPGAEISAPAAASLTGIPAAQIRRQFAELKRASLITEHVPGRYVLHDLLRSYAADLANTHDSSEQRQAAVRRWLDHLVTTAHRATMLLHPHQATIAIGAPQPEVEPETPADSAEAMSWLHTEYPVLTAAVTFSEAVGLLDYVGPLAWAVEQYAHRRAHWDDLPALYQAALRATATLGDVTGQACAHRSLARAYVWLGRPDDAREHYDEALRLFTSTDDLVAQARVQHGLCELFERTGDFARALRHAEQALHLYRRTADLPGQARALNAAGWCHCQLDQPKSAAIACEDALQLVRRLGDRVAEAETWDSLGYAQRLAGRFDAAIDSYHHALELCDELGDQYHVAEVLARLGDTHAAAGQPAKARSAWEQALDILRTIGHPTAGDLEARIRHIENNSRHAGR